LANLEADVASAKEQADLVAVSLHWGIHFVPAVIADYQREAAHAAIDAGADVILGHHAHILKGIELYRGKPVFYSLSNFAMDLHMTPAHADSKGFKEIQQLNPDWVPDFDSSYNFPPDSRRTIIVKLVTEKGALKRCSFLPAFIDTDSVPEVLEADDPRFSEVIDYLREIGDQADLDTELTADGPEVVLVG
jgi:poly-gamma-glutamate synthesis protein (capsule biosynthesis protein)